MGYRVRLRCVEFGGEKSQSSQRPRATEPVKDTAFCRCVSLKNHKAATSHACSFIPEMFASPLLFFSLVPSGRTRHKYLKANRIVTSHVKRIHVRLLRGTRTITREQWHVSR